ncbi:MAG: hypothetical protein WCT12_15945 [Verrucomicrobiota bacterium]
MPRQLRIQYPGAMYHVMSRGNRRQDIFLDDVDRQDFLKTLAEACQLEIPVCDQCWRAPRPWWIAGGILLVLFLASGVPFAIAQDKHADIPKIIPIAMLLLMVGSVACFFVARRRGPVRLVPTKIDRENVRITFFNRDYAERFVEANKETAKVINPWTYG